MNKITKTRVGDEINYFVNGVEGSGTVVKMSNSYVTVLKSGKYENIPLNDTFFVKDIVVNKTWDSMDSGERLEVLSKAHVPSPRYVTKTWDQLPNELKTVIKNNSSNVSAKDGKDDDMNVTHRTFDKSDPCWEGYEQFGMKDKDGKQVPNCVPKGDAKKSDEDKPLNKPMRDDGNKKFKVYVKDPKTGNIVTVRFGDPNMEIKRDDPERRASFRARHDCDNAKDITTPQYWSCKMWEKGTSVTEYTKKDSLVKIEDKKDKDTKVTVLDEWKNEGKKKSTDLEKAIERLNQLKSNVETSVHGNAGSNPNSGVSTSINHDAPEDYEGASHSGIRLEQFEYEDKKPEVKKEHLDLGDTKPTDVHEGGNKYDTKTQPKTINGRAADQEKDKKI